MSWLQWLWIHNEMTRTLNWSFAMYITKHRNSCQMLITAGWTSRCRFIPLCTTWTTWTLQKNAILKIKREWIQTVNTTEAQQMNSVIVLCGWCHSWDLMQAYRWMMPHSRSAACKQVVCTERDKSDQICWGGCMQMTDRGRRWLMRLFTEGRPSGDTPDSPPGQRKQESN